MRKVKIEQLNAYYWELAEWAIHKYKPTKLDVLEKASIDGSCFLGRACPYPMLEEQINKCIFYYGEHEEMCEWKIFERIMALVLPEFKKDADFFTLFSRDYEFWKLNLQYYKQNNRTIFEDYELPVFDWKTWEYWLHKGYKNRESNIIDEETNREEERQGQLLRDYGNKVIEIAQKAVDAL